MVCYVNLNLILFHRKTKKAALQPFLCDIDTGLTSFISDLMWT